MRSGSDGRGPGSPAGQTPGANGSPRPKTILPIQNIFFRITENFFILYTSVPNTDPGPDNNTASRQLLIDLNLLKFPGQILLDCGVVVDILAVRPRQLHVYIRLREKEIFL